MLWDQDEDEVYIDVSEFNKIYGRKGVYNIVANSPWIKYYKNEDMFVMFPAFLEYLSNEYEKCEELYGKFFDKNYSI